MSTYIKPSKNEFMDLKIIIQKDFEILLQVISMLLWMGVVLDEISKPQNVKILLWCVFSLEAPLQ